MLHVELYVREVKLSSGSHYTDITPLLHMYFIIILHHQGVWNHLSDLTIFHNGGFLRLTRSCP